MTSPLKVAPEVTPESDTARLERLEHLLDVMLGALGRITARTKTADLDLGTGDMVNGDIAPGVLTLVRGIAGEAIAAACEDVERRQ